MSYVEQLNNRKQTEYTIRNQDVEISQKTAFNCIYMEKETVELLIPSTHTS